MTNADLQKKVRRQQRIIKELELIMRHQHEILKANGLIQPLSLVDLTPRKPMKEVRV